MADAEKKPTEGQIRDGALRSVQSLRLGQVAAIAGMAPHETRFTVVMDDARSATDARLKRVKQAVEREGFRVVKAWIREATLAVDAVRSRRTHGRVVRIGQDGNRALLTISQASPARVWTVPYACMRRRDEIVLTQAGDQIEIWQDAAHLADGDFEQQASAFRNLSLPELAR